MTDSLPVSDPATGASRIFGRDPVIWTTLVAAVVQFVSAFLIQVPSAAQGAIGAVAVALFGFIGAWKLHDGSWAQVGTVLLKALIALGLAFGLKWTADQQAEAMFLVQAVLALLVRQQVTAPVTALGTRLLR